MESDNSFDFALNVVQRALLKIKTVIDPGCPKLMEQLAKLNDWLLTQARPNNFDPYDTKSLIVQQEKAFAEACTVLEALGVQQPERLSVFKFLARVKYFKEKNKPNEQTQ